MKSFLFKEKKYIVLLFFFILKFSLSSQNILISTGGTVNVNGGEVFLDAGGSAGNDGNTNRLITLCPTAAGKSVCVDFTLFNTYYNASSFSYAYGDSLCLFNGANNTSTKMATLSGNYGAAWNNGTTPTPVGIGVSSGLAAVTTPGIFCSTNANGCITASFYNADATQSPGWSANVVLYEPLGIPGCNINLTASTNTICPGTTVTFTATGSLVSAAINNDFNSGNVGTGWQSTAAATFTNNACLKPSLDGSTYLWMANQACPRTLTSNGMDVSNGGVLSFEYRSPDNNSDPSPCEAPDIGTSSTPEAIFVQYSTNAGTTWNNMKVMFPNNIQSPSFTGDNYLGCGYEVKKWSKIVVPIPTAAKTTNTQFRWIQPRCTSSSTDNWGLDNVVIATSKTSTLTITDITNNIVIATGTTSPISITQTPTATTVYQASITDGTTTCTNNQTITVSGGSVTVTSFSYTSPYCLNGSNPTPTLAPGFTTGGTFSSTPVGLSLSASSGSVNLASSSTGTYIVTYTVPATSCGVASNSTVTLIINPTPTLTVNSPTACSGVSSLITASGASTYSWNTGAITNTINVNPAATTIYTVTGTTSGCSSNKTTTVSIIPQPTLSVNTSTICSGSSTTLTATGATTYSWNTSASTSTLNVSPSTTTVYTVTGTTNGCSSSKTTTVTVSSTPTISSTSSTICAGGTATLTASGGTSYTWTPGSTTNTTLVVSPGSNTTYTVTGSNGTCTSTATSSVTVSGALSITSNSTSICSGTTATLTAAGATTYTWLPMSSNGSSVTVNPTSNTTYTIMGLSGSCTGTTTVNVGVTPQPTLSVNTTTICSGTSASLTATGATTYSWNTGASSSTLTVSPITTTVYTVTGTTNGCTSNQTALVTVIATPILIISSDVVITKGASTSLTVSGGLNYNWTPSSDLTCTSCSNSIASPSITTQYCVTSSNGVCLTTTCVIVTVESDCKSNADYTTPNAFTPNGDGSNDEFCLKGWSECVTSFHIAIFDRWGEKVYDSEDPSFCWDGKYLGVVLNPAVFVFYINAETIDTKKISRKGNITLIR
jgi:gliding motility-associated-like protein